MPTSKRSGLNPQAQEHSIDVLERTNKLISAVGLQAKPIAEVAELKQCATSMFVAIFEAMFRVRVRGIVRVPKYTKDYKENAQLIINALTTAFRVDIAHLNGSLICEGDITAISELVNVFSDIIWGRIQKRRSRSRSASLTRNKRSTSSGKSSGRKSKTNNVKKSSIRSSSGTTSRKKKASSSRSKSTSTLAGKRSTKRKSLKKKSGGSKKKKATKSSRSSNKPTPRPPIPSNKVLRKKKKSKKSKKSNNNSNNNNNNNAVKSADVLIEGNDGGGSMENNNNKSGSNNQDDESPETNDVPEEEDISNENNNNEGEDDARLENDERANSPDLTNLISNVDEVKAAQPLWDLLWKTRATADTKASISPRRAKREESQKRHRMYKKLLREQLRAVEKQVATRKEAEGSRSRAEAHKRRVETIQQQRLHQDLRRAALARMARRRREEERTVDRLFKAALKVERRRLAEQRAETRRAAKLAEIEKKMRLNNIEMTYADRRKMIAEQVKREQKDREIAQYAQKMEIEKMARDLRKAEKQRIQDLIVQLEAQDAQDKDSDWTGLDALALEGPQAAGKLRQMLVKYLGGNAKDAWAKKAAKKAAQMAMQTAGPSLMDSVRSSASSKRQRKKFQRKKKQEKVAKLLEAYC